MSEVTENKDNIYSFAEGKKRHDEKIHAQEFDVSERKSQVILEARQHLKRLIDEIAINFQSELRATDQDLRTIRTPQAFLVAARMNDSYLELALAQLEGFSVSLPADEYMTPVQNEIQAQMAKFERVRFKKFTEAKKPEQLTVTELREYLESTSRLVHQL